MKAFLRSRDPLLVFAALSFLAGLWLLLPVFHEKPGVGRALARAQIAFGEAVIQTGRSTPERLDKVRPLHRHDEIETQSGSEVLLGFESGEEIRLLENSRILLDQEAGRPLIVLLRGDVWVEKTVEQAWVLISREGSRRHLVEDRSVRSLSLSSPRPLEKTTTAENRSLSLVAEKAPSPPLRRLTPDSIQATLKAQRPSFFKCYTQLLQKTPGVSGQASVAFTIEKSGRVSAAEISSSNLQDPAFRRCLVDTVKRIEFKSFNGDPVSALFPLRFD